MNLMNKNMISFITAVSFMMCACTDTTVIPAGDYDSMKGSGKTPQTFVKMEAKPSMTVRIYGFRKRGRAYGARLTT